ncbi:uncharacterized membrane protein (DUF485 family) [Streptomyces sp. 1114.5]|uniref:DUF485 domain-containing protein n=1 Tax=unclassified Streptomyces TaxID=2593676 RepID=UPI000BDBE780|nr:MULTISPECIES: DUF485 domain-containing protein [unclassified Streptomyces]RKT11214.1 uncharacterized membrane protein (DUF485 family) [Streptomyces sp. 1114.5]SOB81456.1 Uncharacterized membrane protein, DUF485 family [Streptomyces sp. 1331.2]
MDSPPITTAPTEVQLIDDSEEFRTLRRSFRSFAFPVTIGFVLWYLLYVLLSCYAPGLMRTKVVGHVNLALVLGLLQFATTFAIAAWYARYADRRIDPAATAIREAHGAVVHAPRESAE